MWWPGTTWCSKGTACPGTIFGVSDFGGRSGQAHASLRAPVARRRAGPARIRASLAGRGRDVGGFAAVRSGTRVATVRGPVPGPLHETLRELFAKRPDLIAPLLRRRLRLPKRPLVAIDSEQTDPRMRQLLPDAVLACPDGTHPELIVVVEVQLGRSEPKRRAWPQYAATAHARYRCPAQVVVITPYEDIARWAARPIRVGVGHTMRAQVIGPSKIPLLGREQIVADPVVGMLSTLAHMDDDRAAERALWTLAGLSTWPEDLGSRLADILQAALTAELRDQLEELMRTGKYEYQSDFAKKYFGQGLEQGHTRGIADSLLTVLRSRGLPVDRQTEQRITNERDETRLETWLRRAVTAATVAELFTED